MLSEVIMKKILSFVLSMTLVAGNSLIVTMPVMASGSTDDNLIEPYGDVLVWKKKIINGRLYKRLWNETKNRWETDWILV